LTSISPFQRKEALANYLRQVMWNGETWPNTWDWHGISYAVMVPAERRAPRLQSDEMALRLRIERASTAS
jgi:hypothetical protein